MAKKKKKTKKTFQETQQVAVEKNQETTPGISVSAGEIEVSQFDKLDRDTLMQDITSMRDGDAIPSITLDILKLPILHSERRIEPGIVLDGQIDRTVEAADYINWWLDNIKKGFDYFKRHQLLSLDYGHIVFEEVQQRGVEYSPYPGVNEITNIITRFAPVEYDGIDEYHYDELMDFSGIKHERIGLDGFTDPIDIPSDKLYIYTHNEEFNDVRGRSELRTARLAWSLKQKVLIAGSRAIQRGVLPIITITNSTLESKAHQIGRTMGNNQQAYIVQEEGKVSVEMAEVKNQGNLMEMLAYLDRQMFFNTLSQFMTSGLGENGSRAATSELKTSYELKANSILQEFETHMQTRCNKAMSISYLAGIPENQWPQFHLGAITQADLTKVAGNIKTLADSTAITFNDDDEKYFREMFGLPEAKINQVVEDDKEDVPEEDKIADELINNLSTKVDRRELTQFELDIFEFESATDAFISNQKEIEDTIQAAIDDTLIEVGKQLATDRTTRPYTRKQQDALLSKLIKIYQRSFAQGNTDVVKEVAKLENKGTELAVPKKIPISVRRSLNKSVEALFSALNNSIESRMSLVTDAWINNKGGVQKALLDWSDVQKGLRRNIITETQAGFTDGRGATIEELTGGKGRFFYTATLDGSLCNTCAPLDATVFTGDEIESLGLSFTQPINPDCQGGTKCRCQWIVQSIGE